MTAEPILGPKVEDLMVELKVRLTQISGRQVKVFFLVAICEAEPGFISTIPGVSVSSKTVTNFEIMEALNNLEKAIWSEARWP